MFREWRDVLSQQHVLRLQISMNDLAACVQEVQALTNLGTIQSSSARACQSQTEQHTMPYRACDLAHDVRRNAFVLESFDEREQVVTKHFKHHAHICAARKHKQAQGCDR